MVRTLALALALSLSGLVLSACSVPNGATLKPKDTTVTVTLNNGETITYRGEIRPQPVLVTFPASVTVRNIADNSDTCGTAPGSENLMQIREPGSGVGQADLVCQKRGWTVPVRVTNYPSNNGSGFGVVNDAVSNQQVGTYNVVWGDS